MLEKTGLLALAVLMASVCFAFSEAVLWASVAFMHLGAAIQNGTFAVSGLIGAAAGYWIFRSAIAHRGD
ncbi:hypothetical protein [Hyphococcus sp.]|jgi:hypothetical protein|uniref:hypothetical protein n=1 Tax=Hyphococcus sp. TaxID=2038636 RepID=UPI003D0963A2